jgi:hypothetical protein
MNYGFLLALGLLFMALRTILTSEAGRLLCVVLSLVLFTLACVASVLGPAAVGG